MKLTILKLASWLTKLYLHARGIYPGKGCMMIGVPCIQNKTGKGGIVIGDDVTIHSSKLANPGITRKSMLATSPGGVISLGRGSGMSGATIWAFNRIEIGEGTLIGFGAVIMDGDAHIQAGDGTWQGTVGRPELASPITIGKNCFIGAQAMILKGVTIGDSCVVGAGAVVRRSMPDNTMAIGNPAIIKPRKEIAG